MPKMTPARSTIRSQVERLNTEQMLTAMAALAEQQTFALKELGDDDKALVNKWIEETVLLMIPCVSLRPDAVEQLQLTIFEKAVIRDFVFDLGFRFFSVWSEGDNSDLSLAKSLANGLALDGPDASLSVIPESVLASMVTAIFSEVKVESRFPWFSLARPRVTVEDFLCSNKHLMVLYMIYLTNSRHPVA